MGVERRRRGLSQGKLTVVGRLKGTPTLRLVHLVRTIMAVVPLMLGWSTELIEQLREGQLDASSLPAPVRHLVERFDPEPLEMAALAALLESALAGPRPEISGQPLSGIPPPARQQEWTA